LRCAEQLLCSLAFADRSALGGFFVRIPGVKRLTLPSPQINLIKNRLDDITKLRTAGYKKSIKGLESTVAEYVRDYLLGSQYL